MVDITGGSGPDTLTGTEGADVLNGLEGDDTLLGNGGNDLLIAGTGYDTLVGGSGDDEFYCGSDFTNADYANGQDGNDKLMLQGNYGSPFVFGAGVLLNIERLELMSGGDVRFGDTANNRYSYDLRTVDANLGAGRILTVDFSALGSEEHVIFSGAAETDGSFVIYGGFGDDTIVGGSGADIFRFGVGRWGSVDDSVNGGAGTDLLSLQLGAGTTALTFGATQIIGIEQLQLLGGAPGSHTVTMHDGSVSTGARLNVDAISFVAGEQLIFDGSAELTGAFIVRGGFGDDTLTGSRNADQLSGGAGNDLLIAGAGYDTLTGGNGDDIIFAGADLTTADLVNGGSGNDQLIVQGNYSSLFVLGGGDLQSIETLVLLAGNDTRFGDTAGNFYSYNLKTQDLNIFQNQTLTVSFDTLRTDENVTFDGSAETDGFFRVNGGFGNDVITGGSRADWIFGGGGSDILTGGGGADTFVYDDVSQSTSMGYDRLSGFDDSADRIDLPFAVTGFFGSASGTLDVGSMDGTFANAFSELGNHQAALFTATSGSLAGLTFAVVDANGVAGYQPGADYVIGFSMPVTPIDPSASIFM